MSKNGKFGKGDIDGYRVADLSEDEGAYYCIIDTLTTKQVIIQALTKEQAEMYAKLLGIDCPIVWAIVNAEAYEAIARKEAN